MPGGTLVLMVLATAFPEQVQLTSAPSSLGTCPAGPLDYSYGATDSVTYTCGGGQSIPLGTTIPLNGVNVDTTTASGTGTEWMKAPQIAVSVNDKASTSNLLPSSLGMPPASTDLAITIAAGPTIMGINPSSGPPGTTVVMITGTNLAAATAINFGTTPGGSLSCLSTTCTVVAPAGTAGTMVPVTVVPSGGTGIPPTFTFSSTSVGGPAIAAINPSSGPPGTTVTITGTNLATATAINGCSTLLWRGLDGTRR